MQISNTMAESDHQQCGQSTRALFAALYWIGRAETQAFDCPTTGPYGAGPYLRIVNGSSRRQPQSWPALAQVVQTIDVKASKRTCRSSLARAQPRKDFRRLARRSPAHTNGINAHTLPDHRKRYLLRMVLRFLARDLNMDFPSTAIAILTEWWNAPSQKAY